MKHIANIIKSPIIKLLALIILISFSDYDTFAQSENNIELVESIPLETILDNPDIRNTQEVWLEMINGAQNTIDIEQFYITNKKGEPLDTILNAIIAAANRGVKVRVIVDSKMFKTYPDDVSWLEAQSPNIVKHVIDFGKLAGGVQHAKFFIVDDREVFLGSQNFDWRALNHIHELGVRIAHKDCIDFYKAIFDYDWCAAEEPFCEDENCCCSFHEPKWQLVSFFKHPKYGVLDLLMTYSCTSSFKCVSLTTGRGFLITHYDKEYTDLYQILQMINLTHTEIVMQFLTYRSDNKEGYWGELDSALIRAAARGVIVKLIVSDWSIGKGTIESLKRLAAVPNIEVKYSAIPDYTGGYISFARVEHCKYIVADHDTWIGSANAEKSYFYNTRNVGMAVVDNEIFSKRVRDIFYLDWNGPYTHSITTDGSYTAREHGEK